VLESFQDLIQEWKLIRESPKAASKIFSRSILGGFFGNMNWIVDDTYYWVTVELSNILMLQLDADLNFTTMICFITQIAMVATYLFSAIILIGPINRIMSNYYALFLIIPLGLLEKNTLIKHKLKKLSLKLTFYKL